MGLFVIAGASCAPPPTRSERQAMLERMWPRPEAVPESALLRAGEDGGDWIDCAVGDGKLTCRTYAITTGSLAEEQTFELCLTAPDLAQLVGYHDFNREGSFLSVMPDAFKLLPAGPPTIYRGEPGSEAVDVELTEKYARLHEVENVEPCLSAVPISGE